MMGSSSIDVSTEMKFSATFKVSNVKSFYNHGDLENKVKVKLMTWNKRSSIMQLGYNYQVCILNAY